MVFISERIVNISDLEALLSGTRLHFEILLDELQKETSQIERINNLAHSVRDTLEKAENFEFCIEKRKCIFKADSLNPTFGENQLNADNQA